MPIQRDKINPISRMGSTSWSQSNMKSSFCLLYEYKMEISSRTKTYLKQQLNFVSLIIIHITIQFKFLTTQCNLLRSRTLEERNSFICQIANLSLVQYQYPVWLKNGVNASERCYKLKIIAINFSNSPRRCILCDNLFEILDTIVCTIPKLLQCQTVKMRV